MQKIKCPLSAYNACNEMAEIVPFGENTKSAKRGNKKVYLRCPVHKSMRFDHASAQAVINQSDNEKKPEVKPEIPQIQEPEQPTNKGEWGF